MNNLIKVLNGENIPSASCPFPMSELPEEEPLYVNAKQYHRILKRRQARAKLEAQGKIPKERKVYISFSVAFEYHNPLVQQFDLIF